MTDFGDAFLCSIFKLSKLVLYHFTTSIVVSNPALYLNNSKASLGSLRCPSLIPPHRVTSDRPSRQKTNTTGIDRSRLGVPVCGLSIVGLTVSVSTHDYMIVGRSVRGNCPSNSLC